MKLLERETYREIDTPTLLLWGDADVALSIRTNYSCAAWRFSLDSVGSSRGRGWMIAA
jgi:pimeloyl-ACP methyl ester carboxylesterase